VAETPFAEGRWLVIPVEIEKEVADIKFFLNWKINPTGK
jgi:hypothetical protein